MRLHQRQLCKVEFWIVNLGDIVKPTRPSPRAGKVTGESLDRRRASSATTSARRQGPGRSQGRGRVSEVSSSRSRPTAISDSGPRKLVLDAGGSGRASSAPGVTSVRGDRPKQSDDPHSQEPDQKAQATRRQDLRPAGRQAQGRQGQEGRQGREGRRQGRGQGQGREEGQGREGREAREGRRGQGQEGRRISRTPPSGRRRIEIHAQQALVNIFRIPDLRNKVLFTIAHARASTASGSGSRSAGRRSDRASTELFQLQSQAAGAVRADGQRSSPSSRAAASEAVDDLRPGHHALHLRGDHLPAPGLRRPTSRSRRSSRRGPSGRQKIQEWTRYAHRGPLPRSRRLRVAQRSSWRRWGSSTASLGRTTRCGG